MRIYAYIAIDPQGQRVSGELAAIDTDEVVARLTAEGMRIESIGVAQHDTDASNDARPKTLSLSETREVGRHISEIVSAGLPLESGLAAVAEEFPGGRVRRELRAIVRDLESGSDLESILTAHRTAGYLPALVRAGAKSGRTAEILESFIAGTQVVSDLNQTFWMALAYPLILLGIMFLTGLFLLYKVVPQFGAIFNNWGITVPWLTVAILGSSEFVVEHGWWALSIGAGAVALICLLFRLLLGKVGTRRFICTIPFIGFLLRWAALARFAPVLSLLIEGRVPLDQALKLAGEASGDVVIQEDCQKLAAGVRSGQSLESAAGAQGRFSASFVRALSWEGHRDGFPDVLRSMADMYAGRARALVALLVAVLPALLVLFVGLTAGTVIIALFMPLIELLDKLS
jgi:type II secretory pathway component PulF